MPRRDTKRKAVIEVQASLRREQQKLRTELDTHHLPEDVYLDVLGHLQSQAFPAGEGILGQRDFEKLFGAGLDEIPPTFKAEIPR